MFREIYNKKYADKKNMQNSRNLGYLAHFMIIVPYRFILLSITKILLFRSMYLKKTITLAQQLHTGTIT